MNRYKRVAILVVTVLTLFFAFIILILPGILRSQAIRWVATNTERTLAIDRIRINPFTLSIELQKFSLSEVTDSTPFIAFERLHVNVSARSLLERGPIIKKLQLEQPIIRLVRTGANTYNFKDLLALGKTAPPRPEDKTKSPLHFSLNNITVIDGSLDFIDQAVTPAVQHRVEDLQLAIPFIGNVAYLVDEYVTPLLKAKVNHAPFVFEGKIKPFADSVEASVEVDFDNLTLPEYDAYLPTELPVQIKTGHLATTLGISYRVTRDAGPQVGLHGDITITGLTVTERDGTPLCFLPMGKLAMDGTEPFSERIELNEILIYGLELSIQRSRQGSWNFQRLINSSAPTSAATEDETADEGKKREVSIDSVRLRGGQLHFFDELPVGGFSTRLEEISFDLRDFNTDGSKSSSFMLSLKSDRAEKASLSGSLSLQPLTTTAKINVSGIPLEAYYPYLATTLTRSPAGILSAGGEMDLDASGAFQLKNGVITVRDLRLPFGGKDKLQLDRFDVGGITIDSRERQAEIGMLAIENGELQFSRDANGVLSPLSLLHPSPEADTDPEQPFAWQIVKADTTGFAVTFSDGSLPETTPFSFRNVTFSVNSLRSAGPTFDSLTAGATYGKQGKLNLSASGRAAPLDITGKLRLQRIPLTGINPYLPDNVLIEMVSADLDAGLNFRLQERPDGMAGEINGGLGVRDFYAIDTVSGDDLLLWESLQFDRIRAELSPLSLHIGGVALNDFQARVIIDPDGTLNLQRVIADEADTPSAESSPGTQSPGHRPKVVVDSITLQKGVIDFTDRHMQPTFQVKMLNLGGHIGNMSSLSGKPAEVDLRGNLRNESPLNISGSIDPLADSLFLDLKIRFSDIELSPASPYAKRYLGYMVEKGKLFLDLDYHIENHRLESRNRIFLDQFTLGEQVESKDATSLPVRLAIALLKDRRGEIHLDLPVTGRTDDPRFSIWGVVWQVLKNLLIKAATSPITLLASMFGGGEEFNAVSFPYGSAGLVETEQEKLKKLAAAINDRPALKLEITGYADSEHDPEAYRNELLQQKMRREKLLDQVKQKETSPGATVGSVTLTREEESKYLETVYKKADFPKPRNFLGLTKKLPEDEMRKLILTNIPAGTEEMEALARGRAAAVRSFLVETGGVPAERIFQKKVDIFTKKEGMSGNRVEFGIAAP